MIKSSVQKTKLLHIMRILYEDSDENNMLGIRDIIKKLAEYGITAERKSIYCDIETLREFGMDIAVVNNKSEGYYMKKREIDSQFLNLIIDVIQSSDLISLDKGAELIGKLKRFSCRQSINKLERPNIIMNKPDSMKDSIYASIENIQTAIMMDVKLGLKHYKWIVTDDKKIKKKIFDMKVSPIVIFRDGSEYSLMCIDDDMGIVNILNLKRMFDTELLVEKRVAYNNTDYADLSCFIKKKKETFGGFEHRVTIVFDNKFVDEVMDRLVGNTTFKKHGKNSFRITSDIFVCNEFFGWISKLGTGAKIIEPEEVAESYKIYLTNLLKQYDT